jgi:hypothetical protein
MRVRKRSRARISAFTWSAVGRDLALKSEAFRSADAQVSEPTV